MKTTILILLISITSLAISWSQAEGTKIENRQFAILLKAKATVLGPDIRLGDVGNIVITDAKIRSKLLSIRIATAPPPGETMEISTAQIKRRLKSAGLSKYVSLLQGPENIRVVTAQVEIDKAIVAEEFA